VKFSFRQILASAAGAVIAALIASIFGVKGTIVGVAIGSAAATFGTAVVAQSIERGHQAVKQVVVRVPETSTLLRRLGGTGAAGVTQTVPADQADPARPDPSAALTEETATSSGHAENAVTMAVSAPYGEHVTEQLPASEDAPSTRQLPITAEAESSPSSAPSGGRRWPVIAGTVAVVFVLSLMFVTAIELIAGQPLANLFGGHSKGNAPSIEKIFETPTTTLPPPTTTTSSSTTTSTTSSSTTTTTAVGETTTSGPGSSTTSSTTPGATTTTSTTAPG
jgi:hypothetical protein